MGRVQEIRDAIAACFNANHEPLTMDQALAWIGVTYPNNDFNRNTLKQQIYRSCPQHVSTTNAPKILWYSKASRKYRLRRDDDLLVSSPTSIEQSVVEEEEEAQADSEFALESHLRDYLVKNLGTIEKGLTLWNYSPPSVEFFIAGRYIDILARDKESVPVVLELKVSKSYDRVVGQALLYRGLLRKHLGVDRVRIMLVAGVISDELKIACEGLGDVSLYEYAISFQTKQVSSIVEEGA